MFHMSLIKANKAIIVEIDNEPVENLLIYCNYHNHGRAEGLPYQQSWYLHPRVCKKSWIFRLCYCI